MFNSQIFESVGMSIVQFIEKWVPNMQLCSSRGVLTDAVFFDVEYFRSVCSLAHCLPLTGLQLHLQLDLAAWIVTLKD